MANRTHESRGGLSSPAAVSLDLFGTLVETPAVSDPAAQLATELERRNIPVPTDWEERYREQHIEEPPEVAVTLSAHVSAALESAGIDTQGHKAPIADAVLAVFDGDVTTRSEAPDVIETLSNRYPVAILSNCSVPTLVERTLEKSTLDPDTFDVIVSSADIGWRKPDRRAFEAVATVLDIPLEELVHIGDDPDTDGAADAAGAQALLLGAHPLDTIPTFLGGES